MSELVELIRRRRAQMIVHSYLYYVMGSPIISDSEWQQWANELVAIGYVEIGFQDEAFEDWDGSTGMHLPKDDRVRLKAEMLLKRARA